MPAPLDCQAQGLQDAFAFVDRNDFETTHHNAT